MQYSVFGTYLFSIQPSVFNSLKLLLKSNVALRIQSKMSMVTISSLQRITASKLAEMLLADTHQPSSDGPVAIVDVRDDGMDPSSIQHTPSYLENIKHVLQ